MHYWRSVSVLVFGRILHLTYAAPSLNMDGPMRKIMIINGEKLTDEPTSVEQRAGALVDLLLPSIDLYHIVAALDHFRINGLTRHQVLIPGQFTNDTPPRPVAFNPHRFLKGLASLTMPYMDILKLDDKQMGDLFPALYAAKLGQWAELRAMFQTATQPNIEATAQRNFQGRRLVSSAFLDFQGDLDMRTDVVETVMVEMTMVQIVAYLVAEGQIGAMFALLEQLRPEYPQCMAYWLRIAVLLTMETAQYHQPSHETYAREGVEDAVEFYRACATLFGLTKAATALEALLVDGATETDAFDLTECSDLLYNPRLTHFASSPLTLLFRFPTYHYSSGSEALGNLPIVDSTTIPLGSL
ncbi:hypothetical protein H4R33_006744 [Dimargaris cristalligena]|uniref:Uncharacterized protein n=1 Tax=Dimargaris cristalligena TaxID=215637 RepID=A0A4P9ZN09_9FUNG|nr:hypothetical protein H4R33_006744 [Dimargaris cristalligena]RKP34535.1 hypothetical protein BJ085DRAFT_31764 [Dimargaris cristalligena]|eukprot:RKP34535.1 hypothetical protein BJ085DRAFT_31764 [Dimargaris cristalligena]